MDENVKKLFKELEEYAKENGFRLNPNREIAEGTVKGLLQNEKMHGEKYCPCRRVTGDKEKDKSIVCPCIYHKKEIEKQGHCLCQLFFK